MSNHGKSKLRWIGIIVIGAMLFGVPVLVGDAVYAQDDLVFTAVVPKTKKSLV